MSIFFPYQSLQARWKSISIMALKYRPIHPYQRFSPSTSNIKAPVSKTTPSGVPTIVKGSRTISEGRSFVHTVTEKGNLKKAALKTGVFVLGIVKDVAEDVVVDEAKDKIFHHKRAEEDDGGQRQTTKETHSTTTANEPHEVHHLYHVHHPSSSSELESQNVLPESENVYLTVTEGGEKKVFLAKIEYIRKFARFLFLPAKRSENYGSRAIFNVPF